MLQMWRIQQVAQILTIAMLAVTLTLTIYPYLRWRDEPFFGTPYIGGIVILLAISAIVWGFAFIWDMRLRMWREQMTVVAEKNPFTKEKMTPKEIMIYRLLWLPLLERFADENPRIGASADALRRWLNRTMKEDTIAENEVKILLEYIGATDLNLLDDRKE